MQGTTHHILFIDDDEMILKRMCLSLFHAASQQRESYQLVRADRDGKLTLEADSLHSDKQTCGYRLATTTGRLVHNFVFYTATNYRGAIAVLNLPYIERLTIISDLGIPNNFDDVQLLQMLNRLALRYLPVNLLFASAEQHNRSVVQRLLNCRKAYFVEKGTEAWAQLPYALVNRSAAFSYQIITNFDLHGWDERISVIPSPILAPPPVSDEFEFDNAPLEWQIPENLVATTAKDIGYAEISASRYVDEDGITVKADGSLPRPSRANQRLQRAWGI